ncbi:phage tail assembly protein [Novosphingopyxis sp. YJ-S2-01]|nr:phage tail assembly protein [Novosphingopyxis sp. YJ-S2-01]
MVTVDLDEVIVRGKQKIGIVQLRKPKSGELRGLSMVDICKLEVTALHELLPRVTSPSLTREEVANLSAADLFTLATEVAGFFLPKRASVDSLVQ